MAGPVGTAVEVHFPFQWHRCGALHLIANSLTLNGSVSASGLDGDFNSGGGAGGSLWLEITNLSGNGTISASGGKGNSRGGGGAVAEFRFDILRTS